MCEYKTEDKNNLRNHISNHRQALTCKDCDFIGANGEHLRNHNENRHSQQTKKETEKTLKLFSCELCDFESNDKKNLKIHKEAAHMREYTTADGNSSKRHTTQHRQTFTCNDCDFNTANEEHLRDHKEIHCLQCSKCSYFAIHTRDLQRHKKTMHGSILNKKKHEPQVENIHKTRIFRSRGMSTSGREGLIAYPVPM